jgi:hypothetical protein
MSATDAKQAGLLTDAPAAGPTADRLQHAALADSIVWAIRSTSADDPLGIALYGSWGQGKSTIGELVRQAFESDSDIAWIRIDAWKYARAPDQQPLRRHYLLQAYEAVGLPKQAEKLRQQFTHVTTSQQINFRIPSWRQAKDAVAHWWRVGQKSVPADVLPLFLFALGLALLTPWFRDFLGVFGANLLAALLLIGSVLILLVPALSRLLAGGLTVQSQADLFRSVEEFEHQFHTFLTHDAARYKRFIFFIDDLDRCDDRFVVDALETLQAYFGAKKCVFIVAADERQLKRAVRARSQGPPSDVIAEVRIPPDETFLEKIFQVTVYVPPLYPENLGHFAEDLSRETRLNSLDASVREHVLSYLIHPDVTSPRQVKVIINDFLMTWEQAERRELVPETNLAQAPLTDDLLFIAKMVVLRAHFPWFYELLRTDPQLLREWPDRPSRDRPSDSDGRATESQIMAAAERATGQARAFTRERDEEVPEDPRISDNAETLVAALRGYLTRTRDTQPGDVMRVQEFVYLRSAEVFAGLSGEGGRLYRVAIANDDLSMLDKAIQDHREQVVPATELALRQARDGYGVERTAARRPLARLLTELASMDLTRLGPEATRILFPEAPDGR